MNGNKINQKKIKKNQKTLLMILKNIKVFDLILILFLKLA